MSPEIFALTSRGLRVFPLSPGSKIPPRGSDWTNAATSNGFAAFDDFSALPGANVGVLANGLVIVDADTKNGDGIAEALAVIGDGRTLTVGTPSGGKHFYFDAGGEQFNNAVRIRPNVDIRAANGYVVGPGSQIGGKYYVVLDDAPIAPLPDSVRALLSAKRDAAPLETKTIGDVDTQGAVDRAIAFLKTAAPAIEGQGGDNHTIKIANRVFDFGISPDTAVGLMADHWNDNCSPPWDFEDLERKVQSAAKSRQDPIGRDKAENFFEDVEPPPAPVDDFDSKFVSLGLSQDEANALPPRPWLVEPWLLKGLVTEIVAAGGTGKSSLAIAIAACVALGDGKYLGINVRESRRVLIVNVEDDVLEMQKRLFAFRKLHGISAEALAGKIDCFNIDFDWQELVKKQGNELKRTDAVDRLIKKIKAGNYGLTFFDPLVEMHRVNENDNGDMAAVMNAFKRIARATDSSVATVHHTGKPPKGDPSAHAGSQSASRGASSIGGAVRAGMTMFTMSPAEAKHYQIPESQRRNYVRVDASKGNLSPHPGESVWFEKVNVPLGNGEGAPAFRPAHLIATNPDHPSREQKDMVYRQLSEWTVSGDIKKFSSEPKARNRLTRALAALPEFIAAGIHEAMCAQALDALCRDELAGIYEDKDGRAKKKGAKKPRRYRAII